MIAATNFSDEAGVAWLRLDRDTFYLCNCRCEIGRDKPAPSSNIL